MRSTTQSKLSEQSFKDYQRETAPTDSKTAVSFVFNTYASRFGLPLIMTPTLPQRVARIYRSAISCLNNLPIRVAVNEKHTSKKHAVSVRWLQEQITDAWGLK